FDSGHRSSGFLFYGGRMIEELTLTKGTYIVFDFETTGLYPNSGDTITEIGAVKISNGEIIERFDELIDPERELSEEIIKITGITNEMLKGKRKEKEVVETFMEWVGDYPMVAHNAKFDISFLEMAFSKYNLGTLKNVVIDTLGLSRYLESKERYHNLATLVKRYNIPWDEDKHHRADYDSEGTALIFHKMLEKLELNNFKKLNDLYKYPFIVIKK
ncbi:MAG: ribonuclease H-like domain-containing protein, partial [Bacilli bacterium]|nr:ribonuclease H-like domain-containing protein [Bacilli bacterium]